MAQYRSTYYGWIIVGVSTLSLTLVYGIRHSFSVFFPSILDEFGWSRASTSLMFSLNVLIYGLVAPVAGRFGDRWNPKGVMITAILILGLLTSSCAFANELWHFWILFGLVMPVAIAFAGWPLMGPALSNWFTDRRGLVMGLSQSGIGFSFAYGIVSELAIENLGWRIAYIILAVLMVAILLPLHIFVYRYRPTSPVFAQRKHFEGVGANHQGKDWTFGTALRTRQLWLLVCSNFLFWGLGTYLVLAHQIKFAEDMGYTRLFASSILVLFGFFMVAGQLSAFISDLIGREVTVALASGLALTALASLISIKDASQPWLLYVYAGCLGYGTGVYTPTIWAAAADIFHGTNYGAISNLMLTGMGIGGAIGPWLGGYFYDIFGTYEYAFALATGAFCLAGVTVLLAAPSKAKKIRARN
jgi:MFS family permease